MPDYHTIAASSQGSGIYAQSLRQGPSVVELIGLFLGPPSTPSLTLPSLSRLLVPRPELGTSSALQTDNAGVFTPPASDVIIRGGRGGSLAPGGGAR